MLFAWSGVPRAPYTSPFERGRRLPNDSVLAGMRCHRVHRGGSSTPRSVATSLPQQASHHVLESPAHQSRRYRAHAHIEVASVPSIPMRSETQHAIGNGSQIIAHGEQPLRRWALHASPGHWLSPIQMRQFISTRVMDDTARFALGKVHFLEVNRDLRIASMVAQAGYGPSTEMRLWYEALEACLQVVAVEARRTEASVHMPRIGTARRRSMAGSSRDSRSHAVPSRDTGHGLHPPGQRVEDNGEGITLRPLRRRPEPHPSHT